MKTFVEQEREREARAIAGPERKRMVKAITTGLIAIAVASAALLITVNIGFDEGTGQDSRKLMVQYANLEPGKTYTARAVWHAEGSDETNESEFPFTADKESGYAEIDLEDTGIQAEKPIIDEIIVLPYIKGQIHNRINIDELESDVPNPTEIEVSLYNTETGEKTGDYTIRDTITVTYPE